MFRRIPRVRQHDPTDCGAACLASIARYHRRNLPIARIRQLAHTDRLGTNVLGLVEAAPSLGFTAKGLKGSIQHLPQAPMPAIAHVVRRDLHHYVVVYRATPKTVMIMDPADGQVHRVPTSEFQGQWSGVLVALVPDVPMPIGLRGLSPRRRFWGLLRPHASVLVEALVGAVVYTVLGLATAVYVQKIVDYVLPDGNRNLLNLMSVAMLGLLAAQVALAMLKNVLLLRTGQHLDATLILSYFRHLLALPQEFFDTRRVGEILSRVNDAIRIRLFINDVLLGLAVNVLIVGISATLIFVYSWKLGLLATALVVAAAPVYLLVNALNRRGQRAVMENGAEFEAQLVESLHGQATIKRFRLEEEATLKTESRLTRLLRAVYGSGRTAIFAGGVAEFGTRFLTICLLWLGGTLVLRGELTAGALMSCYALVGYLTVPLTGLLTLNRTVQDALIAADRLFEIMDLEREDMERGEPIAESAIGDVRFEHVTFRYGTRLDVFKDLDLVVGRGEVVGIVGESGSGKSTLAALLQGVYPVTGGRIVIGTRDLRHVRLDDLRRIVGVVPQQVDLFSDTIAANVALGDPEPDMNRVLNLARDLGLLHVIQQLPLRLETPLGERGLGLSGGQRQLVAIARALYRDPPIVVFDEATSALDSITEQRVQAIVRSLRDAGKTVIVMAHRLATVATADRIVVLGGGAVAEQGTYAQLMARRGRSA